MKMRSMEDFKAKPVFGQMLTLDAIPSESADLDAGTVPTASTARSHHKNRADRRPKKSNKTRKEHHMKSINTTIRLIAVNLVLASSVAFAQGPAAVLHPPAGINLEYIGQGLVVSAAEVYQYGYFTHVAGVENVFSGAPNNASNALFTFLNELATTRVTDNGPLRIVDRKGTATVYLNPEGGADFEDPGSFGAGTPVLTAELRHQVILDTLNNNTIIVNFDLTITAAEIFTVGEIKHRLGRPGQKMTWTAYGRPNTSATQPGQFVFAGMGFIQVP